MAAKAKVPSGTLKKVFVYVKRYIPLIVISVLTAAASVGLTLYVPILAGNAIDCIVGKGNVDLAKIADILHSSCLTLSLSIYYP